MDTSELILTSGGVVTINSGVPIRERIEIVLKSRPLFGNSITGSEAVVFDGGGGVSIHSFDSSLGPYDAYFNRGHYGAVGSRMITARSETNASIYGYLVSDIDTSQIREERRSSAFWEDPLWV